ncbi:hypothetical protein FJV41_08050 [Myxococcus llanfairpwllgwyngyllgogerychwyrndrobwllllantysiliogogogochensis]|uniref:Lipoprotein n=1 Tax=Myxococcus llanfairpwllgwyngyllgogerychwyrndrobwllllantysiliogogogochensis TaxID=2590453 RepID=A0A540X5R6_9BACT|nr:hypothetical protein [Myxococcus llanfairpwllgwyngyllgogerychwyrndrobwllllantysiliogogogochensis]TQF16540.1 hypothetical protein FJV41_08050 [Myxococcus llanfairpwllgwyngyllgogerychwyrndrobwllllantysiliogogogochensis]
MRQVSRRRVLGGVAAALLLGLGGGCSSSHSHKKVETAKVEDSWMARVPPDQMDDVRQAQLVVSTAEEQQERANVSVEDGKRDLQVAQGREQAAEARQQASVDALSAAQETGQADAIDLAQNDLAQANTELAAAKAETALNEKTVTTRESVVQVRERERDVANAELAQTRFLTLQRTGDVRAQQVDGDELARNLEEARAKARDAGDQVDANITEQEQAQSTWEQLDAQTQAYGGSGEP